MKRLVLYVLLLINIVSLRSQSLTDDLLMKKGDICLALTVSEDKWNKYWEGTNLISNLNIGTLTRQSVAPMLGLGFTNTFNLFAELPYVQTFASGGSMRGASGIQDFNFGIKYQVLKTDFNPASLRLFLSANYSLPASNYLSDYLPFSIGLGAHTASLRTILFLNSWNEKIFFRGMASYSHVGTTKAERTYYYADGKSYYTPVMDVPSRYGFEVLIGSRLFHKKLHLEGGMINQTSLTGDDIRRYLAPQATNRMDFTNIVGRVRVFPVSSSSIIFSYSKTMSGRNVGESSAFALAFTHVLNVSKKQINQL